MKAIKFFALLIFASGTQLIAMEETEETQISPEFNYFDKISSHVDLSFGVFALVTARHLPTMRTYSAFISNYDPVQGYYQEKGMTYENRVIIDSVSAHAVYNTLMKISPQTPHSEKKPALDLLHVTLTSRKQCKVAAKDNVTQLTSAHVTVK